MSPRVVPAKAGTNTPRLFSGAIRPTSCKQPMPVVMGPGVSRDDESLIWDDGEPDDVHRRQTGAATAASPEMAILRQARIDPDDRLRPFVFGLLAVGDGWHRHGRHALAR